MKFFKYLGAISIGLYLLAGALLYLLQRDFLYFPSAMVTHEHATQSILAGKATLDIVVLNAGMETAILYFGGNGEAVINNAGNFNHLFSNKTVYLVNYRGYAGSTGTPTESHLFADAQLVYDIFSDRHKSISVIGRSLGSGVAIYLASTRTIDKLVLVTPYNSIANIAQDQYPMFPISLMLKDKYNSAGRVKNIASQTLILLAEHDNVVPLKYSELLIREFDPSQVSVRTIKSTGHNSLSGTREYNELLQEFL
ncbi:MAG: alpha/beta hydrolase [Gammaproteobacteria bacterium]|nr:alpha/beta hydrolase [Gammaproteobacteria bacterium]